MQRHNGRIDAPPGSGDRHRRWSRVGILLGLTVAVLIVLFTLSPPPAAVPLGAGFDKIYHFAGFACLVFPLIVTDPRRWVWVIPAAICFGGAIELVQPHVGRSAEWLDFGANVTGVLTGTVLGELLHNRLRRILPGFGVELDPEPQPTEEERIEAMRAELMAELRAVLREELNAAGNRGLPVMPRRVRRPLAEDTLSAAEDDDEAPDIAPTGNLGELPGERTRCPPMRH